MENDEFYIWKHTRSMYEKRQNDNNIDKIYDICYILLSL